MKKYNLINVYNMDNLQDSNDVEEAILKSILKCKLIHFHFCLSLLFTLI